MGAALGMKPSVHEALLSARAAAGLLRAGQVSQAFRELERALVPYAGTRDGCLTARAYAELAIVGMAAETNRLVTARGVPVDEAFLVDAPAGRSQET